MNALKILAILTCVLSATCYGQLTDNFSDNDFNSNPAWTGDGSKFIVNTGKLKLSGPAISETAFLSTPSNAIHNASWEFYVQLDFTPSSTNYAKVYLTSDRAALNSALNGYFVKIGNTSRDVSLYRQNGTVETRIIDGVDDRINTATVKIRIKVTRNAAGNWQLFSDAGTSGTYTPEGSFTDVINTASSYFGVACVYTSTRSDKFWFDDFIVTGTTVPDTTPPAVVTVAALDPRQVKLIFSEPLESSSASDVVNFSVGNQQPISASLSDDRTVLLVLPNQLTNGVAAPVSVRAVRDLAGNEMLVLAASVLYFSESPTQNKDLIFTEIFPDPSPQVGMPNAEFVEIYNRSSNPINLSNWQLSDGSSKGIFQSRIVLPGEYWIVTSTSSASLFPGTAKIIALSNFPSLNNSTDTLTLRNANGLLVDSLNYDLTWYRDDDKSDGGWSLELIDPDNTCAEASNWVASENKNGGTPGFQNSMFANKPDLTPPQIESIFPSQANTVVIQFSEKLDKQIPDKEKFLFEPYVAVTKVSFTDKTLRGLAIDVTSPLEPRTAYTLRVSNILDCAHNTLESASVAFGLPEKADSMDVVLNEILFNPKSGGVDFVEIFNRSSKYINLKGWKIGNTRDNARRFFAKDYLMAPSSFAVLTSDPGITSSQYPANNPLVLFKSELPSLPDDEGSVCVVNDENRIIDASNYSQDWHSTFLKDKDGVSLERIEPGNISNNAANWTSASSRSGFGTPGVQNSQFKDVLDTEDADITVVPEVFTAGSPPGDFVQIAYNNQFQGWIANIKIYDQQGHVVKTIANDQLLGAAGFFRWDGQHDDSRPARVGYYVVWFQVFHVSGEVRTFCKRVIIMPANP